MYLNCLCFFYLPKTSISGAEIGTGGGGFFGGVLGFRGFNLFCIAKKLCFELPLVYLSTGRKKRR